MHLPSERELRETAIAAVTSILEMTRLYAEKYLSWLGDPKDTAFKDRNNQTRIVDEAAQRAFEMAIVSEFKSKVLIFGEEVTKRAPSVLTGNKIYAFLDPIDGTDLLARDFANWCVAAAFFSPKSKKIVSAVVGHSSGDIYYANEEGAYLRPRIAKENGRYKKNRDTRLVCDASGIKLTDASICFYGQKPRQLLEVVENKGFSEFLKQASKRMVGEKSTSGTTLVPSEKLGLRIYNLGGNPMMVKIPEGRVDVAFSLSGAEAHDVVPGAFIAQQAGATLLDMEGKPLDLGEALVTPRRRIKYVAAASKNLAHELFSVLTKDAHPVQSLIVSVAAGPAVQVLVPPVN